MTINVAILAGGRGTRLAGVWNDAKCLIPVGGVPLIQRLTALALALEPWMVVILLGHEPEGVAEWHRVQHYGSRVRLRREADRIGTAPALRDLIMAMPPDPLLVLNGDTLPFYDLAALVRHHESRLGAWATAAFVHDAARWRDVYAGAAVLSVDAQQEIFRDDRTVDFPAHLLGTQRYIVPGFLDVGTPEGFQRAKEWKE